MTSIIRRKHLVLLVLAGITLLKLGSSVNAQGSKPTVYKIAEAGVQMDLPAGWETSKDANGTYSVTKKDAGGYVVFSVSVLPRDPSLSLDSLFGAFSEGLIENAKKDWKDFKPGTVIKDTAGDMAIRAQKIEGTMESAGGEVEGQVVVIDSPKPLGIFGQRTKKHSDLLDKESTDILESIKKIQ